VRGVCLRTILAPTSLVWSPKYWCLSPSCGRAVAVLGVVGPGRGIRSYPSRARLRERTFERAIVGSSIVRVAFLSPRQFSRLFREETGRSPSKAIERLRVESARLMMEAGRFSAEEIARKNGFGNRERMRRSFIRAFGQPPQTIQRTVKALVQ
jgi:AraC-like DNA-binding protein